MKFMSKKYKLSMDDSQDKIYDEFSNNSQEIDNDQMKIDDYLEYLIQNQESSSFSNSSASN